MTISEDEAEIQHIMRRVQENINVDPMSAAAFAHALVAFKQNLFVSVVKIRPSSPEYLTGMTIHMYRSVIGKWQEFQYIPGCNKPIQFIRDL